ELHYDGEFVNIPSNQDKKNMGFQLRIPPQAVTLDGDQINFDILAVVRATGGKETARLAQRIERKLQPANIAEIKTNGINYTNKLNLPPGQYGVWFVLRDNPTGRTGSLAVPLKVD